MGRKKSIESIALCFCPLFIVVESAIQGLVIGALGSLVLLITGLIIAVVRKLIVFEIHILCILLIAAAMNAILGQILALQYYGLYQILGIYLPLIAINSFTLTRIETIFFTRNILVLLRELPSYTVNIIFCFTVFGFVRELLISGTIIKQFQFSSGIFKLGSGIVLINGKGVGTLFEKETGILFLLAILLLILNCLSSFKKGIR